MAIYPKMTVDQVIASLQRIREKVGGDAHVAIRGRTSKEVNYIDTVGGVVVGKADPYVTVSRGGTPVVRLFAQGE